MISLGQAIGPSFLPLIAYLIGAFGFTWIFHFQIARKNLSVEKGQGFILYWLGLPGPTLAAIVVAIAFGFTNQIALSIRVRPIPLQWWLLAIFIIPAIYTIAIILSSIRTGNKPRLSFHRPKQGWVALLLGQLYVVFSEEIGWRGFALPLLLSIFGKVGGTLILGLIWASWHLPMFSVPTSHQKGAFWHYMYSMIVWSFIMTILVVKNEGNILPAMAFHAAANISYFVMDIPDEAEKYISILLGLVLLLILWLMSSPLI